MQRLQLIKPSLEYKNQIVDMLEEWTLFNNTHETNHSPGAIFAHDYRDFDSYLAYFEKAETNPIEGHVPSSTYFALDKERNVMVGAISIRHYLNETLKNGGGHIGDGIRPSERRKGYATEMIALALDICRNMKLDKVMISCSRDNIGSKKSIINNGGVYERTVIDDGEVTEIYWIYL